MPVDPHANFAYSTVATAPSPATSGLSLVVQAGEGARFPAVPFNATVWPAGSSPLSSNAEIVRVTGISTDTLTITRAQESTSAKSIAVGYQIAATVTAKTLTDVELMAAGAYPVPLVDYVTNNWYSAFLLGTATSTIAPVLNTMYLIPFLPRSTKTFQKIGVRVVAAAAATGTCRMGLYGSNADGSPNITAGPLLDSGAVATTSAATDVTFAASIALTKGVPVWLAVVFQTTVTSLTLTNIPIAGLPVVGGGTTVSGAPGLTSYALTGVSGALPSAGTPALSFSPPPLIALQA